MRCDARPGREMHVRERVPAGARAKRASEKSGVHKDNTCKEQEEKKEMWKVKIKLNNGTEISFPNTFEDLITAGRFADAIAEAYQFALERRVTNKIITEVE